LAPFGAADRRIEKVDALFGKRCVQRADDIHRVGRQVEPSGTTAEAGDKPVLAKADFLHVRRRGQGGEDDVAGLGDRTRRFRPFSAGAQMPGGRLPGQVMHNQVMPRLLQVGGHAGAHHAEPDETNFHCFLLCLFDSG